MPPGAVPASRAQRVLMRRVRSPYCLGQEAWVGAGRAANDGAIPLFHTRLLTNLME
jgi:hypothetical protein